jgi:hypothetical protein
MVLAIAPLTATAGQNAQSGRHAMQPTSDVSLTAKATWSATELRVSYTIANGAEEPIYVLDGTRTRAPATGQPGVATDDYSLFPSSPGEALMLVGIAPLPPNKLVAVRIMPVATKLDPGGTLSRDLRPAPLPLTERTPYITEDELRQLEETRIRQLSFAVQYFRSSTPGLEIAPLPFDATHFVVKTPHTVEDASEARAVLARNELAFHILPGPR